MDTGINVFYISHWSLGGERKRERLTMIKLVTRSKTVFEKGWSIDMEIKN